MSTATITPTAVPNPVWRLLRITYLRLRVRSCDRDIEHCQAGVAALEAQEGVYRDARRQMSDELRSLCAL
jgi:hypothetical protein